MKNLSTNDFLTLSPGQLVSVTVEAAQIMRVDCGLVWVTIEGDENDYWLSAGDALALIPGRHVVIEADKVFSRIDVLPYAALQPRVSRGTDDLLKQGRGAEPLSPATA